LSKLSVFVSWCEEERLSLGDLKQATTRRFLEMLRTKVNDLTGRPICSSTAHGYMRVLKAFLSWLSREEDYEQIVSSRLASRMEMPKVEQGVIEVFSAEQLQALLAACGRESYQRLVTRDRAILSVLVDTGIRASELCGLTLDNAFLDPNDAHLKVFGKGKKWREVALGRRSLTELRRYITRYRHGGKDEQHVFLNRYGAPLTVWGLDQLIDRLGEWASITGVRCSPHTFRHTYAVLYLLGGGDIYSLMRLMGHTSVRVTERYLRAMQARDARRGTSVLDQLSLRAVSMHTAWQTRQDGHYIVQLEWSNQANACI